MAAHLPPTAARGPSLALVVSLMLTLVLVWGSTWLAIKLGLHDVPPFTGAALRFTIAGLGMAVLARRWAAREGGGRPPWSVVLAHGLGQFALNYGIVYLVETVLPSGLVAVLWSVFPLFVALGERFILRSEALSARKWLGMSIAFGGIATLFATDLHSVDGRSVPMGLLLLAAPFASAMSTLFIKRRGSHASSLLLNRDGMLVGAALLWSVAVVREQPLHVHWTLTAAISVGYLALVGTTFAFGTYMWLLRFVPASRLSLISFGVPVVALLVGAAFGGEPLGIRTWLGSALAVGGVVLTVRSSAGRSVGVQSESAVPPAPPAVH